MFSTGQAVGLVPLSLGVSLESGGLVLGVRSEAVSLSCPEARDVRLSQCWQWELIDPYPCFRSIFCRNGTSRAQGSRTPD